MLLGASFACIFFFRDHSPSLIQRQGKYEKQTKRKLSLFFREQEIGSRLVKIPKVTELVSSKFPSEQLSKATSHPFRRVALEAALPTWLPTDMAAGEPSLAPLYLSPRPPQAETPLPTKIPPVALTDCTASRTLQEEGIYVVFEKLDTTIASDQLLEAAFLRAYNDNANASACNPVLLEVQRDSDDGEPLDTEATTEVQGTANQGAYAELVVMTEQIKFKTLSKQVKSSSLFPTPKARGVFVGAMNEFFSKRHLPVHVLSVKEFVSITLSPVWHAPAKPISTPVDPPVFEPIVTPKPTLRPATLEPTYLPTDEPTPSPTPMPVTSAPSPGPTQGPSHKETDAPTSAPTMEPTVAAETPTSHPTRGHAPTTEPTSSTETPTGYPTGGTSLELTKTPTPEPTGQPSVLPTAFPSQKATNLKPTKAPTSEPTGQLSMAPTAFPSQKTTTFQPTKALTPEPTGQPSLLPTAFPSETIESFPPIKAPTSEPTVQSSVAPTVFPSQNPTNMQTTTHKPSLRPTQEPSRTPTIKPTLEATRKPDMASSPEPTTKPPSAIPTKLPTWVPSKALSDSPPKSPTTKKPSPSPTPEPLLGLCKGDCDSSDDCEGDLVCFQRDAGGPKPPGCPFIDIYSVRQQDFCVRQSALQESPMPNTDPSIRPTAKPTFPPTAPPTPMPMRPASASKTSSPTVSPSGSPSNAPFACRSTAPSGSPASKNSSPAVSTSSAPSDALYKSTAPSGKPSSSPTFQASESSKPTSLPSVQPLYLPDFRLQEPELKEVEMVLQGVPLLPSRSVLVWREATEMAIREEVVAVLNNQVESIDVKVTIVSQNPQQFTTQNTMASRNRPPSRLLQNSQGEELPGSPSPTIIYTALSIIFDVKFFIRSVIEDHHTRRYVGAALDAPGDQAKYIYQLTSSGEESFEKLSSIEVILPSEVKVNTAGQVGDDTETLATGITVGLVVASIAGAALIMVAIYMWTSREAFVIEASREQQPLQNLVAYEDDSQNFSFNVVEKPEEAAEVSTLGDPIPQGATAAPLDGSMAEETASLPYDYKLSHTLPSLVDSASYSFSELSSNIGDVPTDDDTLNAQYCSEAQIEVHAPPGLLGLVLEEDFEGVATVYDMKELSPLADRINIGDKVVSVDGRDVSAMPVRLVMQLIASKQNSKVRQLVFSRPSKKVTKRER